MLARADISIDLLRPATVERPAAIMRSDALLPLSRPAVIGGPCSERDPESHKLSGSSRFLAHGSTPRILSLSTETKIATPENQPIEGFYGWSPRLSAQFASTYMGAGARGVIEKTVHPTGVMRHNLLPHYYFTSDDAKLVRAVRVFQKVPVAVRFS